MAVDVTNGVVCPTHCEEAGEGRRGSENLQQVSRAAETVSNKTFSAFTLHL